MRVRWRVKVGMFGFCGLGLGFCFCFGVEGICVMVMRMFIGFFEGSLECVEMVGKGEVLVWGFR